MCASLPPSTMDAGLNMFTSVATTSPISAAASRTTRTARLSPAAISAARSTAPPGPITPRCACNCRAIAGTEAIASMQPTLPQGQRTPAPAATLMWPMSPASPSAPRCNSPSLPTMPQPMPLATLMKSRGERSSGRERASPSAIRFTSLSTSTGIARRSRSQSAIGKPSQPGMIGGRTVTPRSKSTGLATPTTRVRLRVVLGAPSASRGPKRWAISPSTACGPAAMSGLNASSASLWRARSVTTRRACVMPMSATSTTPALAFSVSPTEGRPRPAYVVRCSLSNACSSIGCTCSETVERAMPVMRAMSALPMPPCAAINCTSLLWTSNLPIRNEAAESGPRRPGSRRNGSCMCTAPQRAPGNGLRKNVR
jgi:hypothetical protein